MNGFSFQEQLQTFCETVRRLRQAHGLSQRNMAKQLGIGVGSLRKLERGEIPPRLSVEVLYHIYDTFGVHPADQFRKM